MFLLSKNIDFFAFIISLTWFFRTEIVRKIAGVTKILFSWYLMPKSKLSDAQILFCLVDGESFCNLGNCISKVCRFRTLNRHIRSLVRLLANQIPRRSDLTVTRLWTQSPLKSERLQWLCDLKAVWSQCSSLAAGGCPGSCRETRQCPRCCGFFRRWSHEAA